MKYKNKDVDFSEALVQKRPAPKNKKLVFYYRRRNIGYPNQGK